MSVEQIAIRNIIKGNRMIDIQKELNFRNAFAVLNDIHPEKFIELMDRYYAEYDIRDRYGEDVFPIELYSAKGRYKLEKYISIENIFSEITE